MSVARFDNPGANSREPSPSIWSKFPTERITAHGLGYYFHEDFLNARADAGAEAENGIGPFNIDADAATVFARLSDFGGKLDVETDGDDNDAVALFTSPCFKTSLHSGKSWAFEVAIELGAVADTGMFIGLAANAALSRDVVADDCGALIGQSLVGFQQLTDADDEFDAVYKLDAGTAVEILSNVNDSTALTNAGGTAAAMVADTPRKFGMRFDGKETLRTYVDGYLVASTTLASATFPDNVEMGFIIGFKTGAAAAVSYAIDWARGAYLERM